MKKSVLTALLLPAVILLGLACWLFLESEQEQSVSDEQAKMRPALPVISEQPGEGMPLMDFGGMQASNPDIIGWIAIDGIGVDYPLLQGADNSYYLNHTARKKANKLGALFMDYRVNRDFSDFYSVVYGHNMKSGRMFGRLVRIKEQETFGSVAEGMLYTPEKTYRLEIFAVVVTDVKSDFYRYVFPDIASRGDHLQMIRENAMQYQEIGVTENDRLIALSTCSYEYKDARTIVIARLAE